MKKLQVKDRYLSWEDGAPFFYLGDTAWELFHALSREEIERYFAVRARQGFTAVQCVALAEIEGITTPNYYGRLPLLFEDGIPDPTKPDLDGEYSYWDHVDFAIETAKKYGIVVSLLPTWGDKYNLLWGKGPVIFTPENAYTYGKWIANRYKYHENIIWMLGGDRPLEPPHRSIIDAMAKGIKEVDPNHLMTFHPAGETTSIDFVGDADYIDFHTSQTGHRAKQCYRSDDVMRKMRSASCKPFMDAEPRYEDHPACFNDRLGYYWNADDVRQNAYWNVLTGACGHTYGNHAVWRMNREPSSYNPYSWDVALEHPGAEQIGYVKKLRLSRDYFSLVEATEEILDSNFDGMGHMVGAKGKGYAYVYSPLGVPFTVNLTIFLDAQYIRAFWFDPKTGEETLFAILPTVGKTMLAPPSQGKGCDFVLILEAVY